MTEKLPRRRRVSPLVILALVAILFSLNMSSERGLGTALFVGGLFVLLFVALRALWRFVRSRRG